MMALMVLAYGQDLPDGTYTNIKKPEKNSKDGAFGVFVNGITNYRGWVLGLTYGYCFGVELTMDNIIAEYFYDRFGVNMETAGVIAASFGFANWVSRPTGGVVSDLLGRRFGVRGRLWGLWVVQTVAGLMCLWLGQVAASGLTFGVVPFVSRRSMGVISGMTGSGGTVGAVVTQLLLFSGSNNFLTQTGISIMGVMMIISTLSLTTIYFPKWGGMLCGPSSDHQAYQLLA
ncbi:hypothetical protein L1987_34491 [Smallanthus sonchifolius]|uniref:Uncharacterized protein n=1 Tax=Smallanthus sonchifolius TaxID=185202 RepID=A0ACB9HV78_9ASTR|nr:hypothetical protein L1987_34491 [Smallanthus sonchifolius]